MTEHGADSPDSSNEEPRQTASERTSQRRIGNPTRLVPRRTPPAEPPLQRVDAEPIEPLAEQIRASAPTSGQPGNPLFAPRSFGNGRVQVWGFAPGCLIASLVASVMLTILLNIVF